MCQSVVKVVLINSFEEAYSVQLVKLGLGNVQAVVIKLKFWQSVTLLTSQEPVANDFKVEVVQSIDQYSDKELEDILKERCS